jgi:aspartate aminotransferase
MAIIDHMQDPGTDAIFGIQTEYRQDSRDFKVNLTVGVYVGEDGGSPPIMAALKAGEEKHLANEKTKNYLSIAGDPEYLSLTAKLVFGDMDFERVAMIQTVGGTSALRTGFEFLRKNGYSGVSLSNPTWANHKQIVGNLDYKVHSYPHVKGVKDFAIIRDHLRSLDEKTVVLLQAKCHNPTGLDFTKDQWREISTICKEKNLFPFFDSAYQGFATTLKDDSWAIRYFLDEGHDMMVAHSFSKSFAIYNERVGALFVVMQDKAMVPVIKRNLMKIVRVNYSNPPSHGAASIKEVLKNETLENIWLAELAEHRARINDIRERFGKALIPIFGQEIAGNIIDGHGFFCQIPLTGEEIVRLKDEYGVYMTGSGRVSLPGLRKECFSYVIETLKKIKE